MTVWPLIAVLVLFFLGVPCSFAMLFCTIPYFHFDPFIKMAVVAQKMIANCESTSLMASPFFITAGSIMGYSGITEKLMAFGNACVGHLVGGLGHVNVLVSVLMGGVSGSGAADCASSLANRKRNLSSILFIYFLKIPLKNDFTLFTISEK